MEKLIGTYLTKQDFIKAFNEGRLLHKNKWVVFTGTVGIQTVQIKSYGTWNQVFLVDGLNVPTSHGLKVGQWKKEILEALA